MSLHRDRLKMQLALLGNVVFAALGAVCAVAVKPPRDDAPVIGGSGVVTVRRGRRAAKQARAEAKAQAKAQRREAKRGR